MIDAEKQYRQQLKSEAAKLLGLGLRVLPAEAKNPGVVGSDWQHRQVTQAEIDRAIDNGERPTIGIQAGPYKDATTGQEWLVVMVDIDSPEELEAAKELYGGEIPTCWWAMTGRGDRLIFKVDPSKAPKDCASVKYAGASGAKVMIQIGSGGKAAFAVLPPSKHYLKDPDSQQWICTGKVYTWKPGRSPDDLPLPTLPDDAAQKLLDIVEADAQRKTTSEARLDGVSHREGDPLTGVDHALLQAMVNCTKNLVDSVDGSKRLAVCACRGAEHYVSDDCFLATLEEYERQTSPFLANYSDTQRIERLRQAERRPDVIVGGALAEVQFGEFVPTGIHRLTDDGNADRLLSLANDQIKYVSDLDKWIAWSDAEGRWVMESDDSAIKYRARKGLGESIRNEYLPCAIYSLK